MDTLVGRMGELRRSFEPVPGVANSDGKQPVAPATVTSAEELAVWTRGFGQGEEIDNGVSRVFNQDLGGFLVGIDRRFRLGSSDLYLGGFGGYLYASRDFHDNGSGTTHGLSLGGYLTWIEQHGWYADLVLKFSQYWNDFLTETLFGRLSTGGYNTSAFGGSLEVGKRFDLAEGRFFIEPQAQLAGMASSDVQYQASTGLQVDGESQSSFRGRLGIRAGVHINLSSDHVLEPYLRASAIEEVLGKNTITTNSAHFDSDLSGTTGQFGVGITAWLGKSTSLYGEYDYATSDAIREPWAASIGFRWEW